MKHDVRFMIENHFEEICPQCEGYGMDSDTGYEYCAYDEESDKRRALCEEMVANFVEENGLDEEVRASMKLEFSLEQLTEEIVQSVKNEVKRGISTELKNDIVKQVYKEVAEEQIKEIKNIVSDTVNDMVKSEVERYYTEEEITVGGGFGRKAETHTIKSFTEKTLKEIIEKGEFKARDSRGYSSNVKINDYLTEQMVGTEIKRQMEKAIKDAKKQANENIAKIFEDQLKDMMNDLAMKVLTDNAGHKELKKKLKNTL